MSSLFLLLSFTRFLLQTCQHARTHSLPAKRASISAHTLSCAARMPSAPAASTGSSPCAWMSVFAGSTATCGTPVPAPAPPCSSAAPTAGPGAGLAETAGLTIAELAETAPETSRSAPSAALGKTRNETSVSRKEPCL